MHITSEEFVSLCGNVKSTSAEDLARWRVPPGWVERHDFTWDGRNPIATFLGSDDRYPIKLYVNESKRKAVLAFSSTQDIRKLTQIWIDFGLAIKWGKLSICPYFQSIYDSARGTLIRDYNIDKLDVTGFSLGASLAEIFAAQFGLHALTFDGPGSKDIISAMQAKGEITRDNLSASRIESYLAAPTYINTLQEHVGIVYRLILDPTDDRINPTLASLRSATVGALTRPTFIPEVVALAFKGDSFMHMFHWVIGCVDNFTSQQHSLVNISRLIDPSTQDFRESSCIRMQQWPERSHFDSELFRSLHSLLRGRDPSTVRMYEAISHLPGYIPAASSPTAAAGIFGAGAGGGGGGGGGARATAAAAAASRGGGGGGGGSSYSPPRR